VPGRGTNLVTFHEAGTTELPFADNSLDRVQAIECIFCFPSREAFLREALRVLKPGGMLVVSDFLEARPPRLLRRQKEVLDQAIFRWLGSTSIITESEYHQIAGKVGFERLLIRDITRNTLPTYPSRVAMFKSTSLSMRFLAPRILTVRLLELAARLNFLCYAVLTFKKGVGSALA